MEKMKSFYKNFYLSRLFRCFHHTLVVAEKEPACLNVR